MLTIIKITVKQPEEINLRENFSQSAAPWESFEWCGKGAGILALQQQQKREVLKHNPCG